MKKFNSIEQFNKFYFPIDTKKQKNNRQMRSKTNKEIGEFMASKILSKIKIILTLFLILLFTSNIYAYTEYKREIVYYITYTGVRFNNEEDCKIYERASRLADILKLSKYEPIIKSTSSFDYHSINNSDYENFVKYMINIITTANKQGYDLNFNLVAKYNDSMSKNKFDCVGTSTVSDNSTINRILDKTKYSDIFNQSK